MSPGMTPAVRRLLEWKPRNINEAHRVLQQLWPRVEFGVTLEAFGYYEAQTKATAKVQTSPDPIGITVAPIGIFIP